MQAPIKIQLKHESFPDNYYHYIRDFLISIFYFLNEKFEMPPTGEVFIVSSFPERFLKYEKIASQLFPQIRFEYVSKHAMRGEKLFLMPRVSSVKQSVISDFSRYVLKQFHCSTNPRDIILIERTTKPRDPRIADGRPHLRYIENHDKLRESIAALCQKKNLSFINLKPEEYAFKDQVEIFSKAKCVIGQHGAGLTNIFWMPHSATMVEIQVPKKIPCYQIIANAIGVSYCFFMGVSKNDIDRQQTLLGQEIGRDEIARVDVQEIVNHLEKTI